jgi:hypothetical protein
MAGRDVGVVVQEDGGEWENLAHKLNHDPSNDPKVAAAIRELQMDTHQAHRDYLLSRLDETESDEEPDSDFNDFTAAMRQAARQEIGGAQ